MEFVLTLQIIDLFYGTVSTVYYIDLAQSFCNHV